MARTYTFEPLEAEYTKKWSGMVIKPDLVSSIDRVARKIISGKSRYQAVEASTGVPWAFIGVLHNREAGCDFRGVLHNGEKILGTGRKTKLVPRGRGPFETWEEAAEDALAIKGYKPGFPWSLARCLFEGERFNGFGYRMHGVPSAYLWSYSNQYTRGKYIADGVWSATTVDKQMGIAPLMSRLMDLDEEVSFGSAAPLPARTSPAASAPDVIDPSDGLDPGEIRSLQKRLRDLGYAEVGRPDGIWGPRTAAGVAAFQATSGLKITGKLDTVTAAAMATAGPRPVSEERANTTAKQLAAQGDKVVQLASIGKMASGTTAAGAVAMGVLDKVGEATDRLSLFQTLLTGVPGWVWAGAIVAVAAGLYFTAQRIVAAKVEAVRSGEDAGAA